MIKRENEKGKFGMKKRPQHACEMKDKMVENRRLKSKLRKELMETNIKELLERTAWWSNKQIWRRG